MWGSLAHGTVAFGNDHPVTVIAVIVLVIVFAKASRKGGF